MPARLITKLENKLLYKSLITNSSNGSLIKSRLDNGKLNFIEINGSLDNSVDYLKESLPGWGAGIYDGRRIIFIDEADNLTENAQKLLKVPLEKYAGLFDVIFCLNDFDKIDNAIKSRCNSFCFDIKKEEEDEIKKLVIKRFLSISKKEKKSVKKSDIEEIYSENNGDIRAMLKKLELF